MLTERAQAYLATLQRDEAVPVAEVRRLIEDQGHEARDVWLEFHEQFAGYWEPLGAGDVAIWGLAQVRVSGNWGEPRQVCLNGQPGGRAPTIACADAHPSYDFLLNPTGAYLGTPFPAERFAVKVERTAAQWEFASAGPCRRAYEIAGARITELRDQLLAEMAPFVVPEASDRFARYYVSDDKILLEALEHPSLKLLIRP